VEFLPVTVCETVVGFRIHVHFNVVTVGQCRPLSKTVRFNVVSVENQSDTKPLSIKKQFRM
jgi:ribosomal protein S17